jgi:pimeloyl-ACP methyl ester carboxylesterase
MQFGRKPFGYHEKLIYTYSFDAWKSVTGETLDIDAFPEKGLDDILVMPDGGRLETDEQWAAKAQHIRDQIQRVIGELPSYEGINRSVIVNERRFNDELMKADLPIDEELIAHLTYPVPREEEMPVAIYLHAYLDARGYDWPRGYGYHVSVGERLAQKGFVAVEFDQLGYGLRNRDCGIEFFKENPQLSALGVMIQDVRKIIDSVCILDWVDEDKVMVAGYSLGGMVGLYAAVSDERIQAVASTCGFGSMRLDVHGSQTEGLSRYSHLRPTIPRLGLFLGNEGRIPYDFHEILALIAPRPVLILAPKLDQDWFHEDVAACYGQAVKIYELLGVEENIRLIAPNDFNRYPPEYQDMVNEWLSEVARSL